MIKITDYTVEVIFGELQILRLAIHLVYDSQSLRFDPSYTNYLIFYSIFKVVSLSWIFYLSYHVLIDNNLHN